MDNHFHGHTEDILNGRRRLQQRIHKWFHPTDIRFHGHTEDNLTCHFLPREHK
jgi:hypothetical protein